MRDRRTFLATLAAAAVVAARGADAQTSPAQNWPTKSIRIIVPYPPGGLSDVFARLIGDKLARRLGQSIVIDNRPGGNTIIGTQATAQSAPDGYTLLLTNGALSINQSLVASLPYDLNRDLAPVIWLGESYGVLVVNDRVSARTLPDLIRLAKARPGKLAVGVPGAGTNYRIAIEQLKDITGIDVTVVPYKGSAPAISDVVAGQIEVEIDSIVPLAPQIKDGKIRALAVLATTRTPDLPEAPTTAEAGLPELVLYGYNAILAASATPRPIIERINAAVNEVLADPDTIARGRTLGLRIGGGPPEQLKEIMDKVTEIYAKVIKSANIKPE
ncbi:MAG TPA: tripartite tricarboxylate transporter substrate binding protein [Xanthobacteraceae bacterium]|jgi:tripartite-type tricarboxylate transporter receptor subunit TctC|nr:tripartite tricarboxylate transporter substrate binding protein [Xanthobacteraceae bacterium]